MGYSGKLYVGSIILQNQRETLSISVKIKKKSFYKELKNTFLFSKQKLQPFQSGNFS